MPYITIKNLGEDSFEEKKSEFIGYAKRVESEEEAKEFVAEIKNKHKQARHNCWAYIVGENMSIQRYSDDGEPQGTAGIPILEVMKKQGITDQCGFRKKISRPMTTARLNTAARMESQCISYSRC